MCTDTRTDKTTSDADGHAKVGKGKNSWPPLSQAEKTLLRENRGCFRCRKPFVDHQASTCLTGPPKAKNIVPVTEAYIELFRSDAGAVNQPPLATQDPDTSEDETASATEEDPELKCVSHSDSHLIPHCCISALGSPLYTEVQPLIDSGCTIVLIDTKLIEHLNLQHYPLRKPKHIGMAVNSATEGRVKVIEWVKFRVHSGDGTWSSSTIRAHVIQDLCYEMILGMPFL